MLANRVEMVRKPSLTFPQKNKNIVKISKQKHFFAEAETKIEQPFLEELGFLFLENFHLIVVLHGKSKKPKI
jgi:hypothetical protein